MTTGPGHDTREGRRPAAARGMLALALGLLLAAAGVASAEPAVGEAAPSFSLPGTDGRTYTLEGLLGDHQGLVLAWFPKAFTPG